MFEAVASAEKLSYDQRQKFVSDIVFVSQSGTDITFRTDDNAISRRMKIDSRTGLSVGQKVRVYYVGYLVETFQVEAIERL